MVLGALQSNQTQTNDFPMRRRYLLVARQPAISTLPPGKTSIAKQGLGILVISSS